MVTEGPRLYLTDQQLKALWFIRDYREDEGRSPTQTELGDALGVTQQRAGRIIGELVRKGALLPTDNKERNMRLTRMAIASI